MLRGLYRFYLYTVFITMLLFATFGAQRLLQVVLVQTLFKETYYTISSADLVQAFVFAVVSFVTAGLLGGLHYWLIRRDMQSDAMAGNGTARAFFLNTVELISLPLVVGTGAFFISGLGQQNGGGASYGAAFTITFLALWALIEWERRRAQASTGVAIVFQRLHLYGTQLILLIILTSLWLGTIGLLVDDLFFGGKGSAAAVCGGFIVCQGPNLLSEIAGTLWVVLFWLGYGLLSRNDTASLLRKVLYFLSFGYGIVAVLVGIYRGVSLLILFFLKVVVEQRYISGPFAQYDMISPLTLGLMVVSVYIFWLWSAAGKQPQERIAVLLTAQAIATTLLGVSFWWGCGLVILNILEKVIPSNVALKPDDWATALALIVTGVGYIPLDMLLRQRSARAAFIAPLRGFMLALLGGGILAGAIGGAIALYAYGTALLGSPFDNWLYTALAGLAACTVGLSIVALYLWTSVREHFFGGSSKQKTTPVLSKTETTFVAAPLIPFSSIAEIIDKLLASEVTRDEAIVQIENFVKHSIP
ncbi:MAG: hypothetical protein NVSMB33_00330 [Ktedonobacteraceae bacterium]